MGDFFKFKPTHTQSKPREKTVSVFFMNIYFDSFAIIEKDKRLFK